MGINEDLNRALRVIRLTAWVAIDARKQGVPIESPDFPDWLAHRPAEFWAQIGKECGAENPSFQTISNVIAAYLDAHAADELKRAAAEWVEATSEPMPKRKPRLVVVGKTGPDMESGVQAHVGAGGLRSGTFYERVGDTTMVSDPKRGA